MDFVANLVMQTTSSEHQRKHVLCVWRVDSVVFSNPKCILKWTVLWSYWMDFDDFGCKMMLVNSTFVFFEFGDVNVSCSHSYVQNHTKIR